ncbi:MAG: ATP-dependent Clp protease adaptor ClpS [Bacteroidales bacterium]|nr:ATP-dependent Clp protease adaptor ClpS [Candidatus Physcousia equi]
MEQTQSQQSIHTRFLRREPPRCHVIFHNDDVTTMDFVVMLLERIFRKTRADAEELMMKVHTEGQAIVGTYPLDIAHSKASLAIKLARAEGFPLQITVEEV